jgi:hypothetical protein
MGEGKNNQDKISFSKKSAWLGFTSYVLLLVLIITVVL